MSPRLLCASRVDGVGRYAKVSGEAGCREIAGADGADGGFGESRHSVRFPENMAGAKTARLLTVLHIAASGDVFEVCNAVVGANGVEVIDLVPRRAFSYVRFRDKNVNHTQPWPRALPAAQVDGGVAADARSRRVKEATGAGGCPANVTPDAAFGGNGVSALEPHDWLPNLGAHHG